MAKNKNIDPFVALASPENKFTVDTIEDLKSRTYFNVGDVVGVSGYYAKGDGAGHQRQKKPIGYIGTDAVIGADGSVWGIVHSGEVNVSWFGAKGGGIADDSLILNKVFEWGNADKPKVIFMPRRKYLLENTLFMYSDIPVEGNNCYFIRKNNSSIKKIIHVKSRDSYVEPHQIIANFNICGLNNNFETGNAKDITNTGINGILSEENVVGLSVEGAYMKFRGITIQNCYYGIDTSYSNTYLVEFDKCTLWCNFTAVYSNLKEGVTNSGEQMNFINGIISNNARAFYSNCFGWNFINTSIDYNRCLTIDSTTSIQGTSSSSINFIDCWIENTVHGDDYAKEVYATFLNSSVFFTNCLLNHEKNGATCFIENSGFEGNTSVINCRLVGYTNNYFSKCKNLKSYGNSGNSFYNKFVKLHKNLNLVKNGTFETSDLSSFVGINSTLNILEKTLHVTSTESYFSAQLKITVNTTKKIERILIDTEFQEGVYSCGFDFFKDGIKIKSYMGEGITYGRSIIYGFEQTIVYDKIEVTTHFSGKTGVVIKEVLAYDY